jgi:D-alanyl-D-alanine dipeptidase
MNAFRALPAAASLAACLMMASHAGAQDTMPADFIYLRDVDASIAQDMRYAGSDNFVGRPLPGYEAAECILTRDAAAALKRVQADLATAGLALKVYDCYRPRRAVRAMAQWVHDGRPGNARFFPRTPKSTLLSGYIATYSKHSTGTTVDLTLIDAKPGAVAAFDPNARYGPCIGAAEQRSPDNSLDMGTGFDCFDLNSYTSSPAIGAEHRQRRTLLLSAMAKRGFRNYSHEWWHFTLSGTGNAPAYDFPIRKR